MAGYGDDAKFDAWLTANGYVLPPGAPAKAVLRQRGSSYIDATYGARFSGVPTAGVTQERQWPRTDATYYCSPLDPALVPVPVEEASYFAGYAEGLAPGSLSVTVVAGRLVKRQKVEGAVEREFFEPGEGLSAIQAMTPVMSAIEGLLAPFFKEDVGDDYLLMVVGS